MILLTQEAREAAKVLIKEALKETLEENTLLSNKDEILNVPGVAELLNCTEDTVRDLAQSRNFPCYKPGKSYFFIKSEIFEWVRSHPKQLMNNN